MKFRPFSVVFLQVNGETGEKFAYKDIFQAVGSVASAMHRMGMRKGDVVCLFAENSPQFVFALYGAMVSGIIVSCASSGFKEGKLLLLNEVSMVTSEQHLGKNSSRTKVTFVII